MSKQRELIDRLAQLDTERINPRSTNIDRLSSLEIVKLINSEDQTVATAVERSAEKIATAAEIYADTLKSGGRVFYIGAGTSGRLGVLDAAECPPTFGTDPSQIIGLISGGYDTLILSQEGVEDMSGAAIVDLQKANFSKNDFLIGIAASVRTPYTLSGLEHAIKLGARTAFIFCNEPKGEQNLIDKLSVAIPVLVGPEVITGSTRMKSGTAQKMTLNLISTTAMVLLGKTYGNLMVDLQATSEKLAARSRKILMELFDIELAEADRLLKDSEGSVKTAIVMKEKSCSKDEALTLLSKAGGFISKIG